jgi:hypothetical protein
MPVCQSCNSSMIIAEFARRFLQNGTRVSHSGINPRQPSAQAITLHFLVRAARRRITFARPERVPDPFQKSLAESLVIGIQGRSSKVPGVPAERLASKTLHFHPVRHDAMEDFEATTIATQNLRLIRDRTRSRNGSLLGSSKPGCLHVHNRTASLSRRDGDLRTKAHLRHTAR